MFSATSIAAQILAPDVKAMLAFEAPVVLIRDVTLIDGSGQAPRHGWAVLVDHGRIAAVGPSASMPTPKGARVVDGHGKTLLPGLVGMHEHLFATAAGSATHMYIGAEQTESAPRLYLAAGITTARTTGAPFPYGDLLIKRAIDKGLQAGPTLELTGPYLDGPSDGLGLNWPLSGPQDARETVNFWADRGMTSFKAYDHITPEALRAAIAAAHARGMKITGHLCSVGFTEAVEMGIDNLEHGIETDSEFTPGKAPAVCPSPQAQRAWLAAVDIHGPQIQGLIHTLIAHHVAVTSTLAVFEEEHRIPLEHQAEMKRVMSPIYWQTYIDFRTQDATRPPEAIALSDKAFQNEMAFEREFVRQGGLLMAGCDPTGIADTPAGFGDQREMELLVEAGFTPARAVQIYSANGARYLGRDATIGTIAAGKQADLLLLDGDFERDATAMEHPMLVLQHGQAWDPRKLRDSVVGYAGIR